MARATPPKRHRGTPEITVYGRRAVLEALASPTVRTLEVRVAKETPQDFRNELRAALAGSQSSELELDVTTYNNVFALSHDKRNDQGVVARVRLGNLIDTEGIAAMGKGQNARTPTRVLALDGLTNPQNIGMTVRSACAAGFDAILWPTEGVPWINGLIIKASASTIYSIPIGVCESLPVGLAQLKSQGFEVSALDMEGSVSVFEYAPPHRCVTVVGAETEGIAPDTLALADVLLRIPISDRVESLNAAVAASVMCFAIANREPS